MKRIIALLFLLLVMSGCGKTAEEVPVEEELIVVGISQVGAEFDWRIANSESMKAAFAEENGYRLLFDDARQQQDNQIMAIRKFIQQKVDYIILMPITEFGWESVLQEAKDGGIPVILVDRMVDVEDDSLFTAHVGSDLHEEGRKAVAWMETEYAGRENLNIIHVMGTLGSTPQIGRTEALEKAVAAHENWNLTAQLDVISFDATRNCLKLCMEGKISLAVECNPLQGPLAAEIIQQLENGEIPKEYHYIEETTFTAGCLTKELISTRQN